MMSKIPFCDKPKPFQVFNDISPIKTPNIDIYFFSSNETSTFFIRPSILNTPFVPKYSSHFPFLTVIPGPALGRGRRGARPGPRNLWLIK